MKITSVNLKGDAKCDVKKSHKQSNAMLINDAKDFVNNICDTMDSIMGFLIYLKVRPLQTITIERPKLKLIAEINNESKAINILRKAIRLAELKMDQFEYVFLIKNSEKKTSEKSFESNIRGYISQILFDLYTLKLRLNNFRDYVKSDLLIGMSQRQMHSSE